MRTAIPTSFQLVNTNKTRFEGESEVKSFVNMKSDFNKGAIASCKVVNIITKKGDIPALFTVMDFEGNFA